MRKHIYTAIRIIVITLVFFVAATATINTGFAARDFSKANVQAAALLELDLLKGVSKGNFQLDRAPTRAESIVMLIRLLGKEKQALSSNHTHPFSDVPEWAAQYVGYAYQNNLTKGISEKKFGPNIKIGSNEYVTFLLRSLGFSDDAEEFSYEDPNELAKFTGILTPDVDIDDFLRADMIMLSHNALDAKFKGNQTALLEHLLSLEAFTQEQLDDFQKISDLLLITQKDYVWKEAVTINVSTKDKLANAYIQAIQTLPEEIIILVPIGAEKEYITHLENIMDDFDIYTNTINSVYWINGGRIELRPIYAKSFAALSFLKNPTVPVSEEIKSLALLGFDIYKGIIEEDMSEYDKVKEIHDYIINTTDYDLKRLPESSDLDSVLIRGRAVCTGYARTFDFFADLCDIESKMVVGISGQPGDTSEGHAWNIVCVNGQWYYVDATWDDPISRAGPVLTYDYFLVDDAHLSKTHQWTKNLYPEALNSY